MRVILKRRLAATAALCGLVLFTASKDVSAQQALPQINVTDTRLTGVAATADGGVTRPLGIVGTSTTIISRQDIERAPDATIADILSRETGIQTSSFYGGVSGVGTTIDLRGFGVTGPSNTLILINGRRLNDWDLPGFDLASISKNSIERIEVTRGSSGAVLYGDGAVGGVINIVTRNGAGLPPSARIEGAYGSFRTKEGTVSANTSSGPFSAAIYGNGLSSDGYRSNNSLHQKNAIGDFRYTGDQGSVFVNLGMDDQSLRLPGERQINVPLGIDQYNNERRGTSTPFNYGDKQGARISGGVTRTFAPGFEVIVDGGFRKKDQQAGFFQLFGEQYVDTTLTTASFTPRVNIDQTMWGMPVKIIAGIDLYRTDYESDRSFAKGLPLIHQFEGQQKSLAGYWQQTVGLLPTTDVSFGARVQRNETGLTDIYNPLAPQNFSFPQGGPLDQRETNRAYHVGLEHRLNDNIAVFGRAAQSFRVPNVDERIGNGAITFPLPVPTFALKTQTSEDVEAGVKLRFGKLFVQSSVYRMNIENELHLSPVTFANTNFDPTRRSGVETLMTYQLTESVRVKANVTYTQALFRDGPFAGNFVPVVSRWTGNGGVSWDIWQKYLTFDGIVRYASERYLDNDEVNRGAMMIPSHATVDLRIGGEIHKFFWSFAVQNLFDRKYFDYGIDGSFTFGGVTSNIYNLYPLPGRTLMMRAGVNF